MKQKILMTIMCLCLFSWANSQEKFNGIDSSMGNLYRLSDAKTRSISPENFTGEKGKGGMADPKNEERNVANARHAARDLGQGWKVNPFIIINPKETFTLAEIDESGCIQHIWMTPTGNWRFSILRIYWDDEKEPSVECPVGDFFGMGWGVCPSKLTGCMRKSGKCVQQLLADAFSQKMQNNDGKLGGCPDEALLSDRL